MGKGEVKTKESKNARDLCDSSTEEAHSASRFTFDRAIQLPISSTKV